MAYPGYIREKARSLRIDQHLTLDELSDCLALPRTTIYYWIRDIPLGKARRNSVANGNRAMVDMYRRARETAYAEGTAQFAVLAREPTFRDFISLYIAEGSKRNRNKVAICNSDPSVMVLSVRWMRRLSGREPRFSIQYHADQNLSTLRDFWGGRLDADSERIRMQRKSNSNGLAGRRWRSQHGVLTAEISDTLFRARLQAWMDELRETWLTLADHGA